MRLRARRPHIVLAAGLCAACAGGEPATPPAAAPSAARPTFDSSDAARQAEVDSMLRAFRAGLPEPATLRGGEPTPEAAARALVRALAERDTATLRRLVVDRAEFAWLYFPTTRIARPPYGIDPALLWLQLTANTERDVRKAFDAVPAGAAFIALRCPEPPVVEGDNRLHERCLTAVRRGARTDTLSLFGTIVERGGRVKFLSYANRL